MVQYLQYFVIRLQRQLEKLIPECLQLWFASIVSSMTQFQFILASNNITPYDTVLNVGLDLYLYKCINIKHTKHKKSVKGHDSSQISKVLQLRLSGQLFNCSPLIPSTKLFSSICFLTQLKDIGLNYAKTQPMCGYAASMK